MTAPNERRKRRRRDRAAGKGWETLRGGRTQRVRGGSTRGGESRWEGEVKRETEGVRRREETKRKGAQKKEDRSANKPSSIPLTAAVIQAGRGTLAHWEK